MKVMPLKSTSHHPSGMITIILIGILLLTLIWTYLKASKINATQTVQSEALTKIIEDLNKEMADFDYIQLINRTLAAELQDLTPVTGGSPVRNLIVSPVGSGSNFIEDALTSFPGTFLFREIFQQSPRIRDSTAREEAISDLKKILNCDFSTSEKYLNTMRDHPSPLQNNPRIWKHMRDSPFYTLNFLSNTCKLFPFQTINLNQLLLKDVGELLTDERLNLRIIYIIRDPRGVLASMWQQKKVFNDVAKFESISNWKDLDIIPEELELDYNAAHVLSVKYPDRLKIVRYEDFAGNMLETVRDIFDFLQIPFHNQVENYVESNLASWSSGLMGFKWIYYVTVDELEIIQDHCKGALKLWDYEEIEPEYLETHLIPVVEFDKKAFI